MDDVTCEFVNEKTIDLKVKKTSGAFSDDFPITVTGPTPDSFTLDTSLSGDGSIATPFMDMQTVSNAIAGSYTITETLPIDGSWRVVSVECTDNQGIIVSGTTTSIQVTLDPMDDVTCEFVNEKTIDLKVKKTSGAFSDDFPITVTGPTPDSFTLDTSLSGDGSIATPFMDMQSVTNAEAGSYTISELLPTNGSWRVVSVECTDVETGDTVAGPDESTSITLTLDPMDDIICEFVNEKTVDLKVKKTSGAFSGDFPITVAGPTPDSFTLVTADTDEDGVFMKMQTVSNAIAGSYTITETLPSSDWSVVSVECTDASGATIATSSTTSITVTLNPMDSIQCEFVNTKMAKIIIVKQTVNGNASFDFTATGFLFDPSELSTTTLSGGQSDMSEILMPGQYSVSETLLVDWTNTSITCDDGASPNPSTGNTVTHVATINLDAGEVVTCTFVNELEATDITLARTQGFWSTHKEILIDHWNNDVVRTVSFGSHDLTNDLPNPTTNDGADDIPEVLGGFWSKIPRESDNDKRLPVIDQARMQLLQQLLAAILNEATFGTDYSDGSSGNYITTAINIIDVETDKAVLITLAGNITFINEGGILGEQPLPAGFVLGEVDPKGAKIMADKAAWDDWP